VQAAGIHHLELTLLFLVLLVAGLTTLAQRFKIPYPIVLFLGGVVLSLLPHLPQIALDPDVVFLVVLPPLLYIGGFNTSWRDFHKNIVSILMLAFGLVGFTVFGIALGSSWLIPGFDYRLGAVLGAVVSTTDAIAATAIAKRLGLPRRIRLVAEVGATGVGRDHGLHLRGAAGTKRRAADRLAEVVIRVVHGGMAWPSRPRDPLSPSVGPAALPSARRVPGAFSRNHWGAALLGGRNLRGFFTSSSPLTVHSVPGTRLFAGLGRADRTTEPRAFAVVPGRRSVGTVGVDGQMDRE